jgi:16S rRNA (uracil1498-N3)-methyltransferase
MPAKPSRVHPRFLVPELDPASGEVQLPADESRHLTRVLRLDRGAIVSAFDGRGREYLARVTGVTTSRVTIALLEPVEPPAGPVVPFALVQAVVKGDAMDGIVRDATMMGAAIIEPVLTAHMAVKPALATRRENVDRWRRISIASAKQSRRATLPDVREVVPLESALSAHSSDLTLMFVEPSAGRDTRSMRAFYGSSRPDRAALFVGPEGGWSKGELDTAQGCGAVLVTLGHLTLRAEAVPMAAMAVFSMLWE